MMKMKLKYLCVSAMLIFSFAINAFAQQPDLMYKQANDLYKHEKYDEAIELYGKIIFGGYPSSEIYFNLGNAYYKTGNIAAAILNYERAHRLAPEEDDIEYNLKLANMQTIDKIEPTPMVFYQKWWMSLLGSSTVDERSKTGLLCFFISAFIFMVYLFISNSTVKMITFFSSVLIFLVALFFFTLAWSQHAYQSNHREAIVFSTNEFVKSSPETEGKNLFMLHSGTKVEVMDELQGWLKIKIANGNQGWIATDAVEKI